MNFQSHPSAWMLLLLLAAQAAATPAAPTEKPGFSVLPTTMPLDRYKTLIERSPFAVATEAAPSQAVEAAGFAKDLVLTGAARLSGGEYYITISSKDQNQAQRFAIKSGETYNDISVVSVAWSDAVGKTKVTLKKGSEFGVVSFDEAVLSSNAASPAPLGTPLVNNGPTLSQGVVIPNPNPQRTAGSVVGPNNPGVPPTPSPRRRIIRSTTPAP